MLIEHQHPHNKSIMVSIIGVPNVGKSSLINYLLGMDLSIVTSKAQTTRNRFHCIFTIDRTEVVLVDTPGFHQSGLEFNKRLNQQAAEGMEGADVNLLLVDVNKPIFEQIQTVTNNVESELGETWLVFNKVDRIQMAELLPFKEFFERAQSVVPSIKKFFTISAKTGDGVHDLTGAICDRAEPGPHLYPRGEVSNKNERFFATEYIREKAFEFLNDELPYELAVVIDEYRDIPREKDFSGKEKDKEKDLSCYISASLLVNRPSQRAIVVGTKGSMIKKIGTESRRKIEAMVGGKVHLNLHVKVSPKWFKNNFVLTEIGLPRSNKGARVWRQS